jgi:hypothetical protein
VHAHLVEVHASEVRVEERPRGPVYAIACPVCGEAYDQPIKPRLRDPAFLDEYGSEIRMVAFDMLVHHLVAEHAEA